ncbi:hypothetical protein MTR67_047506 [Solanum verrucosum]|uniref:Uncharacterized protein n=1 Tax=Solanum verrucosum TaxID=315347 RepID=A0AAF0ZWK3_SOLVR|nr:hypothetical protein MTR67_047506 [Solanum verrucosum]
MEESVLIPWRDIDIDKFNNGCLTYLHAVSVSYHQGYREEDQQIEKDLFVAGVFFGSGFGGSAMRIGPLEEVHSIEIWCDESLGN